MISVKWALLRCYAQDEAACEAAREVGARGCGYERGIKRKIRQQVTEAAGASSSSTRTAAARGCGYESGTRRRARQ